MRNRLAMVYLRMGRKKEADALVAEELKILSERTMGSWNLGSWNHGAIYYVLAIDYAYIGNSGKAVQYLDSALYYQYYWSLGYDKDPGFANLRDRADFKKVVKKFGDRKEFMKRAYTNALNRMEASKELKNSLK